MSEQTDMQVAAVAWSVAKLAMAMLAGLVFIYAGLVWLRERDMTQGAVTLGIAAIVVFAAYSAGRTVWSLFRR